MHSQTSAPPAPSSSSLDRLLAGAAYLGYLVGLWLIAPIAVYVLRRRRSRFAAGHAAQAAILHLLLVALLTVCVLLATITGLVAVLFVDVTSSLFTIECLVLLGWCSWLVPLGIHFALTLRGAGRAARGRVDTDSRLGRMSGWLLAQDHGLPPR